MLVGGDGSLYYLANGIGSVVRVRYTNQSISGRITYADDPNLGARNVTVTISAPGGFTTRMTTTDVNGDYIFTDLPLGNTYTVIPTKTGGVNGITAADAVKIGRFAAGLDLPTTNQAFAADVDGDGLITSYDASLVSRYVGSLPGTANVGTWVFNPVNRVFPAFAGTQANQNFTAILLGDVDNSWTPEQPGNEDDIVSAFIPYQSRNPYDLVLDNLTHRNNDRIRRMTRPSTTACDRRFTAKCIRPSGIWDQHSHNGWRYHRPGSPFV